MKRLVLIAVLAGCDPKQMWQPYSPIEAQTRLDQETLTRRAVIAITDAGLSLESSTNGIVLSDWTANDQLGKAIQGTDGERFRIRVVIEKGSYELVAQCQRRMDATAWDDCTEDERRPQWVLDVLARVEKALQRGASRTTTQDAPVVTPPASIDAPPDAKPFVVDPEEPPRK